MFVHITGNPNFKGRIAKDFLEDQIIEAKEKMKLVIAAKKDYDFKGTDGKNITGSFYVAFTETGNALEFSSQKKDHEISEGISEYNEKYAIDLNLRPKIRKDGKLGWSEVIN